MQRYRPYICPFDRLLPHVLEGASVLDVGCGAGLLLALLAWKGRIRRGLRLDLSLPAIALARDAAATQADGGSAVALSFECHSVIAAWPEGLWDVISMVDIMHHLPDAARRAVIVRAAEHLRPGGRLIYKDIGVRPLWRATASRLHDLVIARELVHFTPQHTVEGWAAEQGLTPVHRESINRWWYGHELTVFTRPGEVALSY